MQVLEDVTEYVAMPDGSKQQQKLEQILLNGNNIVLLVCVPSHPVGGCVLCVCLWNMDSCGVGWGRGGVAWEGLRAFLIAPFPPSLTASGGRPGSSPEEAAATYVGPKMAMG